MITGFLKKIFGSHNERMLKLLVPIVDEINGLEPNIKKLSDDELRGKTAEFKQRLERGEELDDLLPEAFAVAHEGSVRASWECVPFDVPVDRRHCSFTRVKSLK